MGLTFDTGALIAIQRRDIRMGVIFETATTDNVTITVPTPVISEWWRGASRRHFEKILEGLTVEPFDEQLAKAVGETLAAVDGSTFVDAVVMVSASLRGDTVYTSDPRDLFRIRDARFRSTRVLTV